jgi:hypothetical protein
MSYLSSIKEVLSTFGSEDNDRAVIFKGAWGTGKTHLWRQVVLEKRDLFQKRNYSYVSLFGINSLKNLKQALFENKVAKESAHIIPNETTLSENIKDLGSRSAGWFRKSSSWLNEISAFGIKGFGPAVEALQFLRVTDTLIVLDDFERKGSGLQDKEILGLISLLIESKNCRVIMLLHENNLSKEYFSYHEKVFDYEIQFTPTPEDAATIVFGSPNGSIESLKNNCIKLEITNIRLLKKIKYYANLIDQPIQKADKKIADQAYLILPLAILSMYGGDNSKVDIDFILNGNPLDYILPGKELTPEENVQINKAQAKADYLSDYGFTQADEFDASIIKFIENGYVEQSTLKSMIGTVERKIDHERQISKLRMAWDLYHASFGDNEARVVSGFKAAINAGLQSFSIHELNSVSEVFTEIGEDKYINDVIDEYITKHLPTQGLTEKDQVFQWPNNSYFSSRLDDYFSSFDEEKPFKDLVFEAFSSPNGIQGRNILEQLAKATEHEYFEYLSTLDDYQFTNIARMLLKCGQVSTSDDARQKLYNDVFLKTYSTLVNLSEQSRLNKARMSKFYGFAKLYGQIKKQMQEAPPIL